jgi:hypothetical protein
LQLEINSVIDVVEKIFQVFFEGQKISELVKNRRVMAVEPGFAQLEPGLRIKVARIIVAEIVHAFFREIMPMRGVLERPVRFAVRHMNLNHAAGLQDAMQFFHYPRDVFEMFENVVEKNFLRTA